MRDKTSYSIPILFVIFNRPEIAYKSFQKIRGTKPKVLYIAQDGARESKQGEEEKVQETRKRILESIDWTCDVKTLFQDYNIGCGKGVYSAITWLFENEDMGIILEDDCAVDPTFFRFMEEMLEKYKDDQRIGMIAGSNMIPMYKDKYSYHYSRYKSCWGWGSWRRAWKNMDLEMKWRNTDYESVINNSGFNGKDAAKWNFQLKCVDNQVVSAWDWQWFFSLAAQNQLCVYPSVNLVSNIGDDADSTHTSFSCITVASKPLGFPLVAPPIIAPDVKFDRLFYQKENTLIIRIGRTIPHSWKNFIRSILTKLK